MPRVIEMMAARMSVQLSHVTSITGERVAEIRLIDEPSRLVVAEIRVTPQEFYNLLSGLVTEASHQGRMIAHEFYPRVGLERVHWTRKIGIGFTDETCQDWADRIRYTLGLDTALVDRRQGGHWATWERWATDSSGYRDLIQGEIDAVPLPEKAP